jgi:glycosyltransferase involved in cell wall biosynthesis
MTYQAGIETKKAALKRGLQTPLVTHMHATEFDRGGKTGHPDIIQIEKEGMDAADRVVAVSHYTKKVINRYYDIPLHKISVVHNGIAQVSQPAFDLHELKKHFKIALFMGRLTMMKGPEYFLKVAQKVTSQDPTVKFVMVGSGDMEKKCLEMAAEYGLTGKIIFSSFLRGKDVNRAYQLADVFLVPSTSEPFGLVALEAIQNGTPVIISKNAGVLETCPNLVAVDFWDIEKMSSSVLEVLHHPAKAQEIVATSKTDLAKLSWKKAAGELKDLYSELLASPSYA